MTNLPKAYIGSTDTIHKICAWCPDKEEAERLANSAEFTKWMHAMANGVSEYIKREISHVICADCAQDMLIKEE